MIAEGPILVLSALFLKQESSIKLASRLCLLMTHGQTATAACAYSQSKSNEAKVSAQLKVLQSSTTPRDP
jgi:hypothetical protein